MPKPRKNKSAPDKGTFVPKLDADGKLDKQSIQQLLGQAILVAECKKSENEAKGQADKIKTGLREACEEFGDKTDNSIILDLGEGFKLRLQFTESESFNEHDALAMLKDKGNAIFSKYTYDSTSSEMLEQAYHNGDITLKELKEVIEIKKGQSFYVDKPRAKK